MDSNALRNLSRRFRGPVVFCAVAVWGAVALTELPAQAATAADERPATRTLFQPPALTTAKPPALTTAEPPAQTAAKPPALAAAEIDPDVPAVYRLPPITEPAPVAQDEPAVEQPAPVAEVEPVVEQPADGGPAADGSALAAQEESAPCQAEDSARPVANVDEPIPEDIDVDADASVGDADAPAPSKDSYAHHEPDQPDAANHHPCDVVARGGPLVEPAVEAGVLPYTPTTAELTAQLLPAVQHACGLAQRGATFAARAEFIQALRRIAQALDAQSDTDEHARALAAGLRALDEADDFAPRGTQLEAEVDVALTASSHRTPVLAGGTVGVTPREAVALYLSYAQQKLGQAVAGQQAGSMALHALGRLYSRLANDGDGDVRYVRKAMTMYLAALEACPQNNLAANELGVLLTHNGRYGEAETVFRRAVSISPTATGYHNLAVVQQKLSRPQEAIANQQQADRLAAWERANGEVSRRKGIQWVTPDALARAGQDAGPPRKNATGKQEAPSETAAVAPNKPTFQAPFAAPPLEADASGPTPARIARPLTAPTRRQVW